MKNLLTQLFGIATGPTVPKCGGCHRPANSGYPTSVHIKFNPLRFRHANEDVEFHVEALYVDIQLDNPTTIIVDSEEVKLCGICSKRLINRARA